MLNFQGVHLQMVVFSIVMLVFWGVSPAEPFPEDMELLIQLMAIPLHIFFFWASLHILYQGNLRVPPVCHPPPP